MYRSHSCFVTNIRNSLGKHNETNTNNRIGYSEHGCLYSSFSLKINQQNYMRTTWVKKKWQKQNNRWKAYCFQLEFLSSRLLILYLFPPLKYLIFFHFYQSHSFCTNYIYTLNNVKDSLYLSSLQFYIHRMLLPHYHKVLLSAVQVYGFRYISLLSQSFVHTYRNLYCNFCTNYIDTLDNDKGNPFLCIFRFNIKNNKHYLDNHKVHSNKARVYDL